MMRLACVHEASTEGLTSHSDVCGGVSQAPQATMAYMGWGWGGVCFSGDGPAVVVDFLSALFLFFHSRWSSLLLHCTYHFIRERDPELLSLVINHYNDTHNHRG